MSRPSLSRQVPKFSKCKSPTASTTGARASSGVVDVGVLHDYTHAVVPCARICLEGDPLLVSVAALDALDRDPLEGCVDGVDTVVTPRFPFICPPSMTGNGPSP